MDARFRPAGGLSPGTDPAALRFITAAVLAGLIITGTVVVIGRPRPAVPAAPRTVDAPAPAQAVGLRLLSEAAQASRSVTYEGEEVLAWWGPHGASTSVVDVWHQRNGHTLTQAAPVTPDGPREIPRAVAAGGLGLRQGLDGNGVLGMSQRLVSLLGANYALAVTGRADVVGRPARIVTIRRGDGSLAARFWLDSATHLPLRRQMYDSRARMVSDVVFARVTFVRGTLAAVPGAGAQPWGDTLGSPQLAGLRARGWPLPGHLPGNLVLLGAKESTAAPGRVVDLDYSDGLSVVSLFVQRGHLPADMSGWSHVALQGHRVYADDPDDLSVAWSAHGFVFTVIAAAPEQTVGRVVAALPHDGGPGFLGRIRRGLHRLFSWASP